ncbi:SDR family NAD(P)-dependent oxidoreductase [Pseudonocardia sp. P1]|nr:short-chain dehydrogenase/reductase SDR [Pseudonocardia sp. Ae707_Ps1]
MASMFVIGAGPGIGRSVAHRFAEGGYDVGLLARSRSGVEVLAEQLPGATATTTADVADEQGLREGLDLLVDRLGVPEVLVHNAGVLRADDVTTLDAVTLRDTFAVNVGGAVTAAAALLPRMAAAGRGRYLLTSGMPEPLPQLASLSLGKAGLRALAELLDRQFAEDDVRTATVTVCGPVAHGTAYDPDDIAAEYARLAALPGNGDWPLDVRFGDPADAAG